MILNGAIIPPLASEQLTMGERGIESAKVILTGFVVVFAVLFLLIGIIKLYSLIINKAQSAADNKKKRSLPKPEQAEALPAITETEPVAADDDSIPEEVVAVIAAAVAALYGESAKPRIRSIKKSGGARTAWANAGILDNTRSF